jgi:hypothetical protein
MQRKGEVDGKREINERLMSYKDRDGYGDG